MREGHSYSGFMQVMGMVGATTHDGGCLRGAKSEGQALYAVGGRTHLLPFFRKCP